MDLCQETFFRAYSKLHLFDKKRTFLPWIMKIAVNISLKHIKKSKAKLIPLNETTMPSTLSLEDQVEANVLLEDCLKKLDINYQILFSLRHGLRLSYAEISFVLEESESSVKSALFRLRNQLKESVNAPGAKMKKIEATGNEK
jgi:RNA polymerase sigma-70 factor (ECF subfamily)